MSGAEPGVDRLIEHIVEKAREQARDIVRKAEDEARRLLEEALAKKHALVEEERRRAEIEARWRREAILSEARRRASMLLVASASRVLNEIEERAWRLLDNLSPETRRASLRVLAAEALALIRDQRGRLESKHLTMVVSARDYDSAVEIARELERDYGVYIEVRKGGIKGGVILEDEAEGVIVDNSYEARMEKARRTVYLDVGRELRHEVV